MWQRKSYPLLRPRVSLAYVHSAARMVFHGKDTLDSVWLRTKVLRKGLCIESETKNRVACIQSTVRWLAIRGSQQTHIHGTGHDRMNEITYLLHPLHRVGLYFHLRQLLLKYFHWFPWTWEIESKIRRSFRFLSCNASRSTLAGEGPAN